MADEDETIAPDATTTDEEDEHDESEEEFTAELASGAKEADPYSEEGREKLEEDDEAKPGELGYAKGSSGGRRHTETSPKPAVKTKYKPKR